MIKSNLISTSPADSVSPICGALSELTTSLIELEQVTSALEQRLQPVVLAAGPSAEGCQKAGAEPPRCPIAVVIEELSARVRRLTRDQRYVIDRIQI